MAIAGFESLGAFYLGGRVDAAGEVHRDQALLYDSKDLTTHAVCLGMTGSGKTGLGIALIEEAIIDGIPVIAIDPKGDLGNLLLGFPNLAAEDFEPWVDPAAALREGKDPRAQALALAELWRQGLAAWGQDGARIARYQAAAEFALYTPGSHAGRSLAVLQSLAAPSAAVRADLEALRDRLAGTIAGLLGLVGLEADPVQSRETILLSSICEHFWSRGQSLDLPMLIRAVQTPPFTQVGVFDLESFYPQSERFALAMRLNGLLASPSFVAWTTGEPLDIPSLLFARDGRPRLSVLSLAHLDDSQRMFFVTLLLNELLAWSRTQPGSASLRAVLYMDEVFGYLPPVANPPSKRPLLTLLKQARASGLGLVLSTQNPVDLDYKALSNIGTWFLGRLQTERDKARVLDGLESVSGGSEIDRGELDRMLSNLDSRVFLMRNVHDDGPTLFHVRWVLSYLAGPLTREQIKRLQPVAANVPPPRVESSADSASRIDSAPQLPPQIEQFYLPAQRTGELLYRPAIVARASLHYVQAKSDVDEWRDLDLVAPLREGAAAEIWDDAEVLPLPRAQWSSDPIPGARFSSLAADAQNPKSYPRWQSMLESALYRDHALKVYSCRDLKLHSKAGESEHEFRARVREAQREARDLEIEKLRERFAPKLQRLEERVRTAEHRVERERGQARQQELSTAVNVGATVLGALFGRKLRSTANVTRVGTAARSAGRVGKERGDVQRSEEQLDVLRAQLDEMNAEFQTSVDALRDREAGAEIEIQEQRIAPRKSDLDVRELAILWLPHCVDADGLLERAY